MPQLKERKEACEFSGKEAVDILRLIRSENVGPRTFFNLISLYGSAEKALEAAPDLSLRGGRNKPIKICSQKDASLEIEKCLEFGAKILTYKDNYYPYLLKNIEDFPPILTYKGNLEHLKRKTMAIVGARNASGNGCRFAFKLAKELGEEGIVIASGLARGIDTAAHKASVDSGTIAVVAGGIDIIYPPENRNLFDEIIDKGIVLAELPFGSVPRGQNFPQRNRIISGLSLGTIVVEASFKSGSLITARMALEQNREVFAVPGFPLDPRCHGTNYLLKEGANLAGSTKDVLDVIKYLEENKKLDIHEAEVNDNFVAPRVVKASDSELKEARNVILAYLGSSPICIDQILTMSTLPISLLFTVILELELAGKIERHRGNKISRKY